jgi:tRNA-Thr(GGU) m(6)t(6)A37 methyltransferase TsaA
MLSIEYTAIGTIRTPFARAEGSPIQPTGAKGTEGRIELDEQYAPGLRDLDGFSHLILLYHCHLCKGFSLEVTPFMDEHPHGLFATRAPKRPNPIGLSIVRLQKIQGNILYLEDVDMLDGSPLLDIKPFVPSFDAPEAERIGWLEQNYQKAKEVRADERFK